jgi:hypothetical protein
LAPPAIDWRYDRSPWALKTGRKRQVELVERVELVEPMGTCKKSPRKGYEPTQYEDIHQKKEHEHQWNFTPKKLLSAPKRLDSHWHPEQRTPAMPWTVIDVHT